MGVLAGIIKSLDAWLGTYDELYALAGDDSVKVCGCCPFSIKKKRCASGASFIQTLGSIALCVTTLFGTGQNHKHMGIKEDDIHKYSSVAVFGSIILNATCLIHLFKNIEAYKGIRQRLKLLLKIAVPMVVVLALANYGFPPDRAPTTGDALCEDWANLGNGSWRRESEGRVLCDTLSLPDEVNAAFADADAQAGGIAEIPGGYEYAQGDRAVYRYTSDPKIPHLGKKICQFAFAALEWVSVEIYIRISKKTTNALHPNKRGCMSTFFKCGSDREAPAPTATAAAEREQNVFQRWWKKIIGSCSGPREPEESENEVETENATDEVTENAIDSEVTENPTDHP